MIEQKIPPKIMPKKNTLNKFNEFCAITTEKVKNKISLLTPFKG